MEVRLFAIDRAAGDTLGPDTTSLHGRYQKNITRGMRNRSVFGLGKLPSCNVGGRQNSIWGVCIWMLRRRYRWFSRLTALASQI